MEIYNNIIIFLKKKQFFWDIALKLSYFYPLFSFKKIPLEISIEPTNVCNLRCPTCPTNRNMNRKKGFMEFSMFKSIIDELKHSKKKSKIFMNFAGEPTLNQDIDKFVQYASDNGHETFISTNVTVLNKDLAIRIIKAGLTNIHLCIDGFTKESHEAYRIGSDFNIVKKNIEDFILAKKDLGKKVPTVTIQTLLTSYSEKEKDKIIEWAKNIGADQINLKSFNVNFGGVKKEDNCEDFLPTKKEFRRKTSQLNKTLCSLSKRNVVVYWNGEVGLCCIDYNNEIKIGNIKEKGFLNTIFSEKTAQKRKLGFQKKFDLCKGCFLSNADFMGVNIAFNNK